MASDGQSSEHQELLPGLPGNIVLTQIVTKLPGGTFQALCSVSRNWRQAIQSREVYKARVRSHTRETLVAVKYIDSRGRRPLGYAVSLYSMRENAFYRLPPMSSLDGTGISYLTRYLSLSADLTLSSLDGILYVENSDGEMGTGVAPRQEPKRVCVLDVAGAKQWKHCASVENPGREYAVNIGSGIVVGGNSYLQGGDEDWFDLTWRKYDPNRGEWRKVDNRSISNVRFAYNVVGLREGLQFFVHGKKYWIRKTSWISSHIISFYNRDLQSWAHGQHFVSCSPLVAELASELNCNSYFEFDLLFILPVNGELVAKALWTSHHRQGLCLTHQKRGVCLLQSRGFETERRSIVWQKINHPFPLNDYWCDICPIQL